MMDKEKGKLIFHVVPGNVCALSGRHCGLHLSSMILNLHDRLFFTERCGLTPRKNEMTTHTHIVTSPYLRMKSIMKII